jgi:hypothetical protein
MSGVRLSAALAVTAVALLAASAAACKPSHQRYQAEPREQRVPPAVRPAAHAFFPWARRSGENALRAGPVYLLALSYRSTITRDGDESDAAGNELHRALVAVAPSYSHPITLTGRRLGRPGPHTTLAFSTNGATHCTVQGLNVSCRARLFDEAQALRVPGGRRWRIVRTMLVLPRTGRFRVVARGPGLRAVIPLAVPGPDWRRTPS